MNVINVECLLMRKCDEKLLNDTLEVENGSVQISKCPNGHGKIKSIMLGQDMTCTL